MPYLGYHQSVFSKHRAFISRDKGNQSRELEKDIDLKEENSSSKLN